MPAILLTIVGIALRFLAPVLFSLFFRVLGEGLRHLFGGKTPVNGERATLKTILAGGAAGGKVATSKNDVESRLAALRQLHADGRLTDQRLAQLTAVIEKERGSQSP